MPGYGRGKPAALTLPPESRPETSQTRASVSKSPIRSDSKSQKLQQVSYNPGPAVRGSISSRGSSRGAFRARGRDGSYTGRGNSNAVASRTPTRLLGDTPAESKWRAKNEPTGTLDLNQFMNLTDRRFWIRYRQAPYDFWIDQT